MAEFNRQDIPSSTFDENSELGLIDAQTNTSGLLEKFKSRGKVMGAIGTAALAFMAGAYSERSTDDAHAAGDVDIFVKQCENQVLYDSIDDAGGYQVLPHSARKIEWNLVFAPIDQRCFDYGKQVVKLYAASFSPKHPITNPARLGSTITFTNPPESKLIKKRQTLTTPIPSNRKISDVETYIWIPKDGYGQSKSVTKMGWGNVGGVGQQ